MEQVCGASPTIPQKIVALVFQKSQILNLELFFFLMSEFAMQVRFSDPLITRLYYNISQSTIVVKFLVTRALSLVRQCQN